MVLWGFFLLLLVVPGLLYLFALLVTYPRCSVCKRKDGLVPLDSPVGRRIAAESQLAPPAKPLRAAQTLKEYRERHGLK